MVLNSNKIIAIDGHDGSGKTMLAELLAKELGGIYVRPFAGENGVRLIQYAESFDYQKVSLFGNELIRKISESYKNEILVYDRHWMTVFTLLENSSRSDKIWHPLPPTTLCVSDVDVTMSRLKKRNEKSFDRNYHVYYIELYQQLASEFDANVLRTDKNDIETCLVELVKWYKTL